MIKILSASRIIISAIMPNRGRRFDEMIAICPGLCVIPLNITQVTLHRKEMIHSVASNLKPTCRFHPLH